MDVKYMMIMHTIPPKYIVYFKQNVRESHRRDCRLAAFKNDFALALSYADHVVITEVYSVQETGPWNVCGKDLAAFIVGCTSEYISALDDVVDKLALEICKDPFRETVILTLGAGNINTVDPKLLHGLQKRLCKA